MKVFVIVFCVVAGCACLELQRAEDGEKNLKPNNNAMKAASLTADGTINEDQYALSKDATAPDQPAVTSPSEIKPRSAAKTTIMTSDVKRSGQSVYVGRRVIDIWSVFKHSHSNISALRYSMKGRRRFPGTSAAIRDKDKDFAIHRKRSSRAKRSEGRWVKNNMTVEEHKRYVKCLDQVFVNAMYKDERYPDIKRLALESLKKEVALVDSLAKSGTVSTDVLNEYKAAKTAERKFLHHALNTHSMKQFDVIRTHDIGTYEFLSHDPQRYDEYELHKTYGAFLDKPSPARDRYIAMKDKEWATAQSYFDAPEGPDIYEGQTENEFEGLPPVDNDAKPDFECPRKKRESGSVSPKVNAQVFLILICVVIGILIPGLQVLEIDEEDPNANKNTMTVKRFVPGADRNRVCVRAPE